MRRKLVSLATVLIMTLSFTACSAQNYSSALQSAISNSGDEETDTAGSSGSADEYGDYEGRIGDRMKTAFFDFTVNSAYTCKDYHGFTPREGNTLLVVDVTIKNTMRESIPMYDTDFQAQWNDDSDDAYAYPITLDMETGEEVEEAYVSEEQLPYEYELSVGETREGSLVYEVPEGNKDFSISVLEIFSDGSEGDVYFVFFTAQEKEGNL